MDGMTAQTYRSSVRIKVLGPVEASVDEVGVVLGGPQQRLLLALLVSANGETVSADRLIEQIWGDDPPAAA